MPIDGDAVAKYLPAAGDACRLWPATAKRAGRRKILAAGRLLPLEQQPPAGPLLISVPLDLGAAL